MRFPLQSTWNWKASARSGRVTPGAPFGLALASLLLAAPALAAPQGQLGDVKATQKISQLEGGFMGRLRTLDQFGRAVAAVGDLDGSGRQFIAVGAVNDDDGGMAFSDDFGAVWIVGLNSDGTAFSDAKISNKFGNFDAELNIRDQLGRTVASIGDWDGDGTPDIAVGATRDDDGGVNRGAVYMMFLTPQGSVKSYEKISQLQPGFPIQLDDIDEFGRGIALIDDLDGDGVRELAVSASHDDDGGNNRGAVYILFMNADATVRDFQKISQTQGGFSGLIDNDTFWGLSLCNAGDVDGDGISDLAVGGPKDDDGSFRSGAVWILFLNQDGTVKADQKISQVEGGLSLVIGYGAEFGTAVAPLGDLNDDGTPDLAVGAILDDHGEGNNDQGAFYTLFLRPDGTVKRMRRINRTEGGFTGDLDNHDWFGASIANLGDLDGDGIVDLAVGARFDDDGTTDRGAVYIVSMDVGGPRADIFGGGLNPAGSLQVTAGAPRLGQQVVVGVDDPGGNFRPGSIPFLFVSQRRLPNYPAGVLLQGMSMQGSHQPGELLVDISPSQLFATVTGEGWEGTGQPASFPLEIPEDPAVVGAVAYLQGALFDATAPPGVYRIGLTEAIRMQVGP